MFATTIKAWPPQLWIDLVDQRTCRRQALHRQPTDDAATPGQSNPEPP
jgi:hypothetical protein